MTRPRTCGPTRGNRTRMRKPAFAMAIARTQLIPHASIREALGTIELAMRVGGPLVREAAALLRGRVSRLGAFGGGSFGSGGGLSFS